MAVDEKNLKQMVDARVGALADAASEAGGVLARQAFLQAATVKGTGTAIAANKSIVDAVGHTGSAHLNTGVDADTQYLTRTAVAGQTAKSIADYAAHAVAPTYACYPSLANDTTLTGPAGAWAYGNYAEIVAANGIAVTYWIAGINLSGFSAQDTFQVEIATGGAGAEVPVAVVKYSAALAVEDGQIFELPVPIKVAANTRVAGRTANGGGGSKTVNCSIRVATGL